MLINNQSLVIDILEAKFLEIFPEYYSQKQYNEKFIEYLYKYIKKSIYSGTHDDLCLKLNQLKKFSSTLRIEESIDKQTYTITDDLGINSNILTSLDDILKEYYNYDYVVISNNRVTVKVNFGWLPPNTLGWLNLINDYCLLDYHISSDAKLVKNTYDPDDPFVPKDGLICYAIPNLSLGDNVMFLANLEAMNITQSTNLNVTVTTAVMNDNNYANALLEDRYIVQNDNFYYRIAGEKYNRVYNNPKRVLILQVPFKYAISSNFYLFNVSNAVKLKQQNQIVLFSYKNFKSYFDQFDMKNIDVLENIIFDSDYNGAFETTLLQLLFGDFIWKTSDSKLIAYAQNLVKTTIQEDTSSIKTNGIWTTELSNVVKQFKSKLEPSIATIYNDDVIDKITETALLDVFKKSNDLDPNNVLFNKY